MSEQPDFSGHWRASLERSRFATQTPLSLDVLIEHSGDSLRQKVLSVAQDGAEQAALCVVPRPGGEIRLVDFWSLSIDQRTLTMAHRDDALAGQTVELELVAMRRSSEPASDRPSATE